MKFVLDKITRLALRFRAVTIALVFVLMALGVISWTRLNQELLPPIEIPQTIILTQTGGMTSEQVLTIVTQPLEERLSQIDDIINIQSETQGTFGSFLTAFNDFGLDQETLRAQIQEAVQDVWLPLRTLEADNAAELISELDAAVLIYIAEADSNFLFQLTPETWSALSDDTIEQVLAYMAQQADEATSANNALQRLVDKEIVPQLATVNNVARVDVSGGESLPESEELAEAQPIVQVGGGSLLLRISSEVWAVVAPRVDGLEELNESAVSQLASINVTIPEPSAPPALPESWRFDTAGVPTLFDNASDLLEVTGFTRPASGVLNGFLADGKITGALGQTNDLTVDTVERMLALDPTMSAYFDAEQILAMPEDVFAYLVSREDFTENLDGFTRDAIAARIMATSIAGIDPDTIERIPVELPNAWRVQPPQLITFSFSDIPLATFSVSATGNIVLEEDQVIVVSPTEVEEELTEGVIEAPEDAVEESPETPTAVVVEDAPLPPFFGQLSGALGVPLDFTSDLIGLSVPEEAQFLFNADTISAAQFLNAIANPPDLSEIPADQLPDELASIPPALFNQLIQSLIGGLTADNIAYLVVNEPGFADELAPETIALLSASATAALTGESGETITAEAPAINAEWAELGALLAGFTGTSVTLDTADDLLNPALGLQFILPELLNIPNVADLLNGLFGGLPVEAAEYIVAQSPAFFEGLPTPVLVFLSDDVLAVLPENIRETAPGALLPSAWEALFAQTGTVGRSFFTTSDILSLDSDNRASVVLNRINDAPVGDALESYTVRLMDSLTPEVIDVFIANEPDFFEQLDSDVLLKFNSVTLNMLSTAQINALSNVNAEQATQLLNIRSNPEESAFAQLAALYALDVPAGDPNAPALNPGWQSLGNFYNIELDSADDFFRFPEGFPFPSGAELINSLFGNAQGESAAPGWLGGLPVDAVVYIQDRDETFFYNVNNRALGLMSPEALAVLPEELQEAAQESAAVFRAQSQITRTNGNNSLFITIFKESDANTVSTFADVQRLLNSIDSQDPNIEIGIVFEQSSFIEQSIEGVAREGSLGAVFAIIIILIFLSGGTWGLKGRRLVGSLMAALFLGLLLLLIASNVNAAGGDWGQAFAQSDTVFRVLLIFGVLAGFFVLLWPGNVPDPSWRATLVIAVSIPLSIMTALVGMYWVAPAMHGLIAPLAGSGGFFAFLLQLFPDDLTLNIMTLSGLTVAVGRVVDDSIVVLENIFRQLQATTAMENATIAEKRALRKEAIIQGTRDVSAAIFTATLIAASVFLPLGLTGGLIGAFFLPFGLAVTYALVGSFTVAITVIPVLAYLFIDFEDVPEDSDLWLADYYRPILKLSLKNGFTKAVVIVFALASIAIAGVLFSQRPFAFLPNFGEPQVSVNVNMPSGTSILVTNELVEEIEDWVLENIGLERVTAIQTTVGGAGASFEALLTGNSVSENQASVTIGLNVSDRELNELTKLIELEAKQIFNTCPTSSAPANSTEQRALMQTAEVDSALDIVCADGMPINNHVSVAAASISDGGFGGFALVISGPVTAEVNGAIVEAINSVDGISRAQSNFVDISQSDGAATFIRVNQVEAFSYTAELNTENTIGVTQLALEAIREIPVIAQQLCENETITADCFRVSEGFESEIQTEGFQSIGIAIALAIGLVVIVLSFTMQSFVYWLAIVFSIMVAPIGAAIALTLTNRVLGISAMIGLLMLIGLVIANGVVLIDRVRSNRRERGMALQEALVEAGGRRLRPILMTSLATIIALTPLAVGLSDGAIIASELGTVVIGGVLSSTVLTLIVVPVAFSLLSPIHRLLSFRKDAETR